MNPMIEGRDRIRLQVDPKHSSQAASFFHRRSTDRVYRVCRVSRV